MNVLYCIVFPSFYTYPFVSLSCLPTYPPPISPSSVCQFLSTALLIPSPSLFLLIPFPPALRSTHVKVMSYSSVLRLTKPYNSAQSRLTVIFSCTLLTPIMCSLPLYHRLTGSIILTTGLHGSVLRASSSGLTEGGEHSFYTLNTIDRVLFCPVLSVILSLMVSSSLRKLKLLSQYRRT